MSASLPFSLHYIRMCFPKIQISQLIFNGHPFLHKCSPLQDNPFQDLALLFLEIPRAQVSIAFPRGLLLLLLLFVFVLSKVDTQLDIGFRCDSDSLQGHVHHRHGCHLSPHNAITIPWTIFPMLFYRTSL